MRAVGYVDLYILARASLSHIIQRDPVLRWNMALRAAQIMSGDVEKAKDTRTSVSFAAAVKMMMALMSPHGNNTGSGGRVSREGSNGGVDGDAGQKSVSCGSSVGSQRSRGRQQGPAHRISTDPDMCVGNPGWWRKNSPNLYNSKN